MGEIKIDSETIKNFEEKFKELNALLAKHHQVPPPPQKELDEDLAKVEKVIRELKEQEEPQLTLLAQRFLQPFIVDVLYSGGKEATFGISSRPGMVMRNPEPKKRFLEIILNVFDEWEDLPLIQKMFFVRSPNLHSKKMTPFECMLDLRNRKNPDRNIILSFLLERFPYWVNVKTFRYRDGDESPMLMRREFYLDAPSRLPKSPEKTLILHALESRDPDLVLLLLQYNPNMLVKSNMSVIPGDRESPLTPLEYFRCKKAEYIKFGDYEKKIDEIETRLQQATDAQQIKKQPRMAAIRESDFGDLPPDLLRNIAEAEGSAEMSPKTQFEEAKSRRKQQSRKSDQHPKGKVQSDKKPKTPSPDGLSLDDEDEHPKPL